MTLSFLIIVVVILLVVGLLLWCVDQIPSLPAPVPAVIKILVVLAFAVWLLNQAHVIG